MRSSLCWSNTLGESSQGGGEVSMFPALSYCVGHIRMLAVLPHLFSSRYSLNSHYIDLDGLNIKGDSSLPIGSMYDIYANIYHPYTPNVSKYTSTMDPSWVIFFVKSR